MSAVLRVSVVLLLLATVARADDLPAPTLVAVRIDNRPTATAPQGGVITLVGRDLHACPPLPSPLPGDPQPPNTCRHEELSVRLEDEAWGAKAAAGKPLLLLDPDSAHVMAVVPQDTPVGRYEVVVAIRGRGEARLPLEVVAQVTEEGPAARLDPPGWMQRAPVEIDRFVLVRGPDGPTIEVGGPAAPLPDGCLIGVTLDFGGGWRHEWSVPVTEGRFDARFGPYERELPARRLAAIVLFELDKQPRVRSRALLRTLRPGEAGTFERIERFEWLDVGTPADAARQRALVKETVRLIVDDLVLLVQELDAWRARAVVARLRLPLGGRPLRFDLRAYRAWTTTRLEPELDRLRQPSPLEQLTIVPVNPYVRPRLERLFELVVEWSDGLAHEKRVDFEASRARFDHERQALLRFVGLED